MPSCAAMTEQYLTLARQAYEAWNRGDADWLLEHMTGDVDLEPMREYGGFEKAYRGHDGWNRFWKSWRKAWSKIEVRVERMEDMGEHGVLALVRFEGVPRTGGDEVSVTVSHWLKFRDGLISSVTAMTPETADRRREVRS